jgi:hypothetical protein
MSSLSVPPHLQPCVSDWVYGISYDGHVGSMWVMLALSQGLWAFLFRRTPAYSTLVFLAYRANELAIN